MKRPLLFALELVVAMAIAVFGAWLAAKAGHKMNAKANGDIRAAAAQERIATALEALNQKATTRSYYTELAAGKYSHWVLETDGSWVEIANTSKQWHR